MAADMRAGFEKGDLETGPRAGKRRRHAGNAAADDDEIGRGAPLALDGAPWAHEAAIGIERQAKGAPRLEETGKKTRRGAIRKDAIFNAIPGGRALHREGVDGRVGIGDGWRGAFAQADGRARMGAHRVDT
jgi:hypothetical protein